MNKKIINETSLQCRLESRCTDDVISGRVGGAIILVKQNGKTLYKGSFGTTGSEKELNDKTLFRLASMTKPITAIAILK